MTAPLRGTPHASALPASQTAPVAEFRCLFTHDIRRKQKRWQDGYLKFHTFNNRVMVSDQARNHIGDTYWKESNELHEGDELTLDKGVMVEVAEAMGITQTDLTPLFEKRAKEPTKEPPARPAPSAAVRPFQRPTSVAPSNVARTGTQLRHKSLNTLLGTPKGPVGKAVPMKSPYEARKEKEKENEVGQERAPKRQKTAQRYTGWRASSPVQGDESPRSRTADAKTARTPQVPSPAKAITISSQSDHIPIFTSDVTLPSTPAKTVKAKAPPVTSAPTLPPTVRHEPPPVNTPKVPRAKVRLPKAKTVETPKRAAPTSSPPVSVSNRLTNVDFAVQAVQQPPKKASPQLSPPRDPKAKSLRLSTGVKRGMLLCQAIPRQTLRANSQLKASAPQPSINKTSRPVTKEPSSAFPDMNESNSGGATLSTARKCPGTKSRRPTHDAEAEITSMNLDQSRTVLEVSQDVFDDPEVYHGFMDQQLFVPSSPLECDEPNHSPREIGLNRSPGAKAKERSKPRGRPIVDVHDDESTASRPDKSKVAVTRQRSSNMVNKKLGTGRTVSPPCKAVFEPPLSPQRQVSHAHTDASGTRSRTTSTSPMKTTISTGGFRKKPKRNSREGATHTSHSLDKMVPTPRRETIALPPHPLRADKDGPLMSTTELASLLKKPKKPKKRPKTEDPIEDDAKAPGKSPARKIRRVRSANDAPIPSTADDWEKRNLPKPSSHLTEVEVPAPLQKKQSALAALTKKTDPRKKFHRTQSLNVDTNALATGEAQLQSPVLDTDVGPWSTEAFDLFDWRPPVRDKATVGMA